MPTLKFDWWLENKVAIHGWGFEIWMVNNSRYCGKKIFVNRGKQCSIHYHKKKYETFFINQGRVRVIVWDHPFEKVSEKMHNKILSPGQKITIEALRPHLFVGIDPINEIIEISTEHNEEDTHRLLPGD